VNDFDPPIASTVLWSRFGLVARLRGARTVWFEACAAWNRRLHQLDHVHGTITRQLEIVAIPQRGKRLVVGVSAYEHPAGNLVDGSRDVLKGRVVSRIDSGTTRCEEIVSDQSDSCEPSVLLHRNRAGLLVRRQQLFQGRASERRRRGTRRKILETHFRKLDV